MYVKGENNKEWAASFLLNNLGYKSLDDVPHGRHYDYVHTLLELARGREFGDIEFYEIEAIVREENNKNLGQEREK